MFKGIKKSLLLIGFCFFTVSGYAYDVGNARKINSTCALCHGLYGQGTPGSMSPRLAGLPAKYIAKEMRFYRDGTRKYAPMVLTSSIKGMSDKDIDDISEYLAVINLERMNLPEIPVFKGDFKGGKKLFKKECKTCHGREAEGKPKKGAPMLAGQYASYIFSQISKFKTRERYHDDDPDDDLFDDFSEKQIQSLASHLTTLTFHKKTEREKLASLQKQPSQEESMKGMIAMVGMSGMMGMTAREAKPKSAIAKKCSGAECDEELTGTFKVTSRGEIILSPAQKDLRLIAGLRGRFTMSKSGGLELQLDNN